MEKGGKGSGLGWGLFKNMFKPTKKKVKEGGLDPDAFEQEMNTLGKQRLWQAEAGEAAKMVYEGIKRKRKLFQPKKGQ